MSEQKSINIIMVGPSGVGKTSLLASMYSHIRDEVRELGCTFVSGAGCTDELEERKAELKRLAEAPGVRVDLDLGPKPSPEERTFDFILQIKQGIPNVSLKFIDLPGGWYVGRGDFEKADTMLAESQVVVVAVDAWALMEQKDDSGIGKYNAQINKPSVICQALERASIKQAGAPPVILFVLVKAEKYLHNDQGEELFQTAEACYKPLMESLIVKKYPIAGCWVETIGGLELNSVIERDGRPIGNFRRLQGKQGGYHPRHCSVPLRLVFRMALESVSNGTSTHPGGFWETLKEWVAEKVGVKTELAKNIETHKEMRTLAERLTERLNGEPLVWINEPR